MKRKYDDMILIDESGVNKKRHISKKVLSKDEFFVIVSYLNYKDIRNFDIIFKDHEFLEIIKNRRQKCIENLYNVLPKSCQDGLEENKECTCKDFPCKKVRLVTKASSFAFSTFPVVSCKCGGEHLRNSVSEKYITFINSEEEMIKAMKDNYFTCMKMSGNSKLKYNSYFNFYLMAESLFDFCGFISSEITRIYIETPAILCIGFDSNNEFFMGLSFAKSQSIDINDIEQHYHKYLHKDVIEERFELKIKRFN